MGHNNIRLVKVVAIVVIVISVLAALYFKNKEGSTESSFKPMVKVEDQIYLWDDEREVDLTSLEKIGEIEFSYKTLNKKLESSDKNYSSNVFRVGSTIYRYDESKIVVVDGKQGKQCTMCTILKK